MAKCKKKKGRESSLCVFGEKNWGLGNIHKTCLLKFQYFYLEVIFDFDLDVFDEHPQNVREIFPFFFGKKVIKNFWFVPYDLTIFQDLTSSKKVFFFVSP